MEDADLSGMKVWVTQPGKDSRPTKVLAEGRGNTKQKWVKEAIDTTYSLMTNYRNKDCM